MYRYVEPFATYTDRECNAVIKSVRRHLFRWSGSMYWDSVTLRSLHPQWYRALVGASNRQRMLDGRPPHSDRVGG